MEHAVKLKAARDALDGAETTAKLAANVRSAGHAPAVQLQPASSKVCKISEILICKGTCALCACTQGGLLP